MIIHTSMHALMHTHTYTHMHTNTYTLRSHVLKLGEIKHMKLKKEISP